MTKPQVQLIVRMEERLRERLRVAAAKRRQSMAAMVRAVIDEETAKEEAKQ